MLCWDVSVSRWKLWPHGGAGGEGHVMDPPQVFNLQQLQDVRPAALSGVTVSSAGWLFSAWWIMPETLVSWSLSRSAALSQIGFSLTTAECVWQAAGQVGRVDQVDRVAASCVCGLITAGRPQTCCFCFWLRGTSAGLTVGGCHSHWKQVCEVCEVCVHLQSTNKPSCYVFHLIHCE